MTVLRTLATHEVVQRTFPRPPPTEADQVAMAVGKAIDGTLAQVGYEARLGRRPTQTAALAHAGALLGEALAEAAVELPSAERERILARVRDVVQAYRRSAIFGLTRPKSRVIVIGGEVGVYAQPDFWDGRSRFYELKSYLAIPPPPDVALQVRLFQLAFPSLEGVLVCIDRHATPITTTVAALPPPTDPERDDALRLAFDLGREFGREKVLEYMEGPFVRYDRPGARGTGSSAP